MSPIVLSQWSIDLLVLIRGNQLGQLKFKCPLATLRVNADVQNMKLIHQWQDGMHNDIYTCSVIVVS